MAKKKKTWQEKLATDNGLPKICPIPERMSARSGSGTLVIPAPREVDALMRKATAGRLVTIDAMQRALALKHDATIACPITTGIFAWIAAHAAAEGKGRTTAYWRTLKSGGELNPKYPGGIPEQRRLLEEEGHVVVQKGKALFCAGLRETPGRPLIIRRVHFNFVAAISETNGAEAVMLFA